MRLRNITTSLLCLSCLSFVTINANEDMDIPQTTKTIKDITKTQIEEVKKIKAVKYNINTNVLKNEIYLPIYKVNIIDVKRDILIDEIENIFDFNPIDSKIYTNQNNSLSKMIIDNQGRSIELFNSGAIFYTKNIKTPKNEKDILKLNGLTKERAKDFFAKKAETFLRNNELMKDNMFFKRITFRTIQKITSIDAINLKKGIKPSIENAKIVGVAVHFGYKIGDIPTWGAGSEITVYFDKDGVSGYFNQIRDFSEYKHEESLISQKDAISKYISNKQPKTLLKSVPMIVEEVYINNIQLVYHLKGVTEVQNKIEPKYLISGNFIGTDLNGKKIKSKFEWLETAIK